MAAPLRSGWRGRPERAEPQAAQLPPAKKVSTRAEEQILVLRRERRLGVKRIRAELRRLLDVRLSPSVIHKALVRHGLNVSYAEIWVTA